MARADSCSAAQIGRVGVHLDVDACCLQRHPCPVELGAQTAGPVPGDRGAHLAQGLAADLLDVVDLGCGPVRVVRAPVVRPARTSAR